MGAASAGFRTRPAHATQATRGKRARGFAHGHSETCVPGRERAPLTGRTAPSASASLASVELAAPSSAQAALRAPAPHAVSASWTRRAPASAAGVARTARSSARAQTCSPAPCTASATSTPSASATLSIVARLASTWSVPPHPRPRSPSLSKHAHQPQQSNI